MVRIIEAQPGTGYEQPSNEQFDALLQVVLTARPDMKKIADRGPKEFSAAFRRAFWAAGLMFRTDNPNKRYFHDHVGNANALLERTARPPIDGNHLLCACLAHGDIIWQPADDNVGQLPGLALDPFHGRRCRAGWKDILRGERGLLPPKTLSPSARPQLERSPVKVFQENRAGQMVELDPMTGRDLWSS